MSVPEEAPRRADVRLEDVASMRDFGWHLTLARERAGMTVRDVAKAVGLPSSTVGGYFGGSHLPPVKPSNLLADILAACSVTDPSVVAQWMDALSRVRHATSRRGGATAPYRGLASFQPEHAGWFFGREDLTSLLVERLADRYALGDALLIVVGPSGSGKSSLLRAGMIPALAAGGLALADCQTWPTLLFSPGGHPLMEFAGQLAPMAGLTVEEIASILRSDPSSCGQIVRRAMVVAAGVAQSDDNGDGPGGSDDGQSDGKVQERRLIVVVDQFEEVFTACPDDDERRAFISALCAAACATADRKQAPGIPTSVTPSPPAIVVLGLRADFYAQALQHPLLAHALQDAQLVVGPMTEAEVRRAILEPARKANLDVADGLVELLLHEFAPSARTSGSDPAHDAGALPLLSHALLATWRRSRRGQLTVTDYRETGGIQGAVARTAEGVFEGLTAVQKELTRRLFLRLVHVADDAADTRRRVARRELLPDANYSQPTELDLVLDKFIGQRLITTGSDTVEITHEALLTAWPRLRGWIDTDRAGLHTHRQLTEAAQTWASTQHDPLALYRGSRLHAARDWAAEPTHAEDLNTFERAFLDRSTEQELAETRATRRRTRRLQQLAAALTALILIVGALSAYAFRERTTATEQRNLAISRQVAIEANQLRTTDIALAMQLSLAAYRIAPTPEARSSVLDAFATPAVTRINGPAGVMQSVAVTGNGRTMATAGTGPSLQLWNVARPGRPVVYGRPLVGHTDTIYAVAFRPDGRILASASGDKTIRLWDVANPDKASLIGAPLTGPANTVYSVAFSPDGHTLAAGSADNTVRLWDISDPSRPTPLAPPLAGPTGYVQSIAFSPDGHTLAAGSADKTVRLWDTTDPHQPTSLGSPLTGSGKSVLSVAFSPDGRTLAAGSADDTVRLWALTDFHAPTALGTPLTGPASFVNSVAFSPDGRSLAAASSDNEVWIWNLDTHAVTVSLPHPAPVTAVVFGHNGNTITTSAADGTARIWDLPGPVMTGPTKDIFTAAFGTGNHILAVTSTDNTAQLWNVTDVRHPIRLGPTLTNASKIGQPSGAAALSPDAHTLAIATLQGDIQLWDVTDPARPEPTPVQLTGFTAAVEAVNFSPNGRILVASGNDHSTRLWDVTDPRRPAQLGKPLTGPDNYVYSPVISPDGRTLAVGSADDKVWLWDIANPAKPVPLGPPLTGPTSYVYAVALSPNGRILAAGSADSKVRLWDIANPAKPVPLGPPLTGPVNYVNSVAFSPDGSTLAATAGDGTIWLWETTNPHRPGLLARLTGPTGPVFTDAFDTDRPVLATAGADKTVRLWNTDTDQVATYICGTTGSSITAAEWNEYIPGLPYNPPCQ
jgi:WD40 repeat protein